MSDREPKLEEAETVAAPAGATPPEARPAVEPTLARGDKLGRYMIVDQLGKGGMGVVYTAFDAELDRKIALKVLRPGAGDGTDANERRARLQREAQAMARVSHPNVIHVYDVGAIDDQVFIAMELVDGQTLKAWGTRRRPWREILKVYRAAGRGLAAAHDAGLVHRDFKPDNVLVGADGRVRVLDFGLARAAGDDDAAAPRRGSLKLGDLERSRDTKIDTPLTETGFVVGTPAYMAPEQHRGDATDARADQFGFCVALWEALFGARPFEGDTADKLAENVAAGRVVDPPRTRVPDPVIRALRRGLSADPADRFATMDPLIAAMAVPPSRLKRNLAIAAGVVAVLGLGAAYGVHRYNNRLITEHYANFTEVYGKPRGITSLDADARSRRESYWRMSHRRGRVLQMQRVSGTGRPAPDDTGAWTWDYLYADGDTLREIVSRDKRDRVVLRLLVSSDQTRLERRDENDNPVPLPGTDASVIQREFDDAGHAVRQRFTNVYGAPRPDERRAYGYQAVIGELGMPVEWIALGADGSPTPTASGIARVSRSYDANGNLVEERFYGADDAPILSEDAIAGLRYSYDAAGNRTETTSLGLDGEVGFNRFGYAIAATTFDERGQPVSVDYLDPARKRVQPSTGMSARMSYDDRGNLMELSFVGASGALTPNQHGVAVIHHQYDDDDNRVVSSWFDAERKPTLNPEGAAVERSSYDEHGNRTEAHYFDTRGNPTFVKDGYARIRATYDDDGRTTSESYLGSKGNPVRVAEGYASIQFRYDSRGRRIEESFHSARGGLAYSTAGYAMVRTEYDEHGKPVVIRYLDPEGKPAVSTSGVSVRRYEYDDRGNTAAERYYDADDAPTTHKNGYAAIIREFDGRGHPATVTYLGTGGTPVRNADGVATESFEYDERGRVERTWYRGPDGEPTVHRHGYTEVRYQYDERSRPVVESYYDADGERTVRDHGYARVNRQYDEDGNVVHEAFFDAGGAPTLNEIGAAELHSKYDDKGNRTEIVAFGVTGKPTVTNDWYARLVMQYDLRGNRIRRSHYGPDGELMHNGDGFAIEQSTYDKRGNLTMTGFLGTHEKPINTARGYAFVRRYWDKRGREIRRTFLDEKSQIVAGERGVATVESKYDNLGRVIRLDFIDVKGRPTLDASGVAATLITHDIRGNQVRTNYVDLEGKPATRTDGVAVLEASYDAVGRPVEIATLNVDGEPVANPEGVARTRLAYDSRGRLVSERYFGVDGAPVNSNNGYAGVTIVNDDRGREVQRSFIDASGKPGESVQGVHRLVKRYDQRGNQIQLDAFDRAGKPTGIGTGPAGFVYTYEAPDRLVRILGYDTRGEAVEGTMYLDQLYVWRYRGGKLYFFDAGRSAVTDPAILRSLSQRAWAMMRSHAMEKLRAAQPALFAGARGLLVVEVPDDSEATRVGLAVGDILLAYDGQPLDSTDDLDRAAGAAIAKTEIQLLILRAGQQLSLEARPRLLGAVLEPQ